MSLSDLTKGLSPADALKFLNQAVQDVHTSRYLDVAAVTCVLYDILITIDQERSLIWPARWSYGKILYFLTRYPVAIEEILWLVYAVDMDASEPYRILSLIGSLVHANFISCKFEAYLGVWATLIFLIPLQIVIILRVIAVWDRRRSIVILLCFSLIATDIIILVTLSRVTHVFTYSMEEFVRPILGCESGMLALSPTITIPAWAGLIAFDTVLFVLTLAKAFHSFKTARTRLLTVLIRDGFAYYCAMLFLGVSNLLLLSALPSKRVGLATSLTPVLRCSYSVIGSRIVLNLRGAASSHINRDAQHQDVRLVELSSSSSSNPQESRAETLVQTPRSFQAQTTNTEGWRPWISLSATPDNAWENKMPAHV